MIDWASWMVLALGVYLLAGLVFALLFTVVPARGLIRVDPGAQGMPLSARLLILPGVAALWPLMLFKWLRQPPRLA